MIIKYNFESRSYPLVDKKRVKPGSNVFTVIVGRNGTGKSRFISSIVNQLIKEKSSKISNGNKELEFKEYELGNIEFDKEPFKIIAVSTSPFDRFPLMRFRRTNRNYSYLGIRELLSQNFGLAYMSKVIGSLIEAIVREPGQLKRITDVLKYLGYTDRMHIRFNTRINVKYFALLTGAANTYEVFEEMHKNRPLNSVNRRFFENEDGSVSKNQVNYLVRALKRISDSDQLTKGYSILEIDKGGIRPQYSFNEFYNDLIFFIHSGIIRLSDIVLEKIDSRTPYSINSASSGEQSTIISLLGIASQIKDYSVICIDEPEICLHPEWQERYIQLLVDTFCTYKGCHFIIATHSPQIVSNLTAENSFILTMENREIINANEVVKQSADFQLANVFNSPGF
jgi:predicted ATPase